MDICQPSRLLVSFVRGYAEQVSSSFFLSLAHLKLVTEESGGCIGSSPLSVARAPPVGRAVCISTFLVYSEGAYIPLQPPRRMTPAAPTDYPTSPPAANADTQAPGRRPPDAGAGPVPKVVNFEYRGWCSLFLGE